MPSAALSLMTMSVKLGAEVEVSWMPGPVEFSIVPPEPGVPVPVTVTPAEDPVSSRMMPLSAVLLALLSVLLDETLWNVTPAAPIVVFSITSAPSPELLSVLPARSR